MTVSEKQLQANRENAQKGGVKTPEGKAMVKYNALKHGLLAKEAVITAGDRCYYGNFGQVPALPTVKEYRKRNHYR